MKQALVTGANGFVGTALLSRLLREPGLDVVGAVRSATHALPPGVNRRVVHGLGPDTDWRAALDGVDTVFHLAARVHVLRDTSADPLLEFRRANVQGTMQLARQAAALGVRRLVFVSSIKVNGEQTAPGQPFRAESTPAPVDPYGISKHEAEQELLRLGRETALEVSIVRPPLVYGPGVKANFRAMMKWLARGVPLPLGAVDNRRSLVALDNLVDLLVLCARHPQAPGHVFLASDGEALSTAELLRRLGLALGRPARLLPVPPTLLAAGLRLLGKRDFVNRLLGSLEVDSSLARELLGWTPPLAVDEALARTAQAFLGADSPGSVTHREAA